MKIFTKKLNNKNLLILGDSVSAKATIGFENMTYSDYLYQHYKMKNINNMAIGGTTITYMFKDSNIYKEYKDNTVAIDCCRLINKIDNLKDFDVAIIMYGHNDMYFQVPIGNINDTVKTLDDCNSFISSYKYVIEKLIRANKNMKIVIMNCTYSEYAQPNASPYYNNLSYKDYRKACKEIAKFYNLEYIDPWRFTKKYFDGKTDKIYYKDDVHLSPKGHQILADYLISK